MTNYNSQTDDDLLRGVLFRADARSSIDDPDGADELLALFLEGQLRGDDRVAFFQYLDTHPAVRAMVGQCVKHIGPCEVESPAAAAAARSIKSSHPDWIATGIQRVREFFAVLPRRGYAFAIATVLFIAVTSALWLNSQSPGNLHVAEMHERGGKSPAEYGLSPDRENRITIMGSGEEQAPDSMQDLLGTLPDDRESAELKEAYGFLHRKLLKQAQEAFIKATGQFPESYFAWLGRGIAFHLGKQADDLSQAEDAYRKAIKLHSHPDGARIGLAMVLSEQEGKVAEALAVWKQVDLQRQPAAQRVEIEREIARLENLASKARGE
jgi:hypothetical protein